MAKDLKSCDELLEKALRLENQLYNRRATILGVALEPLAPFEASQNVPHSEYRLEECARNVNEIQDSLKKLRKHGIGRPDHGVARAERKPDEKSKRNPKYDLTTSVPAMRRLLDPLILKFVINNTLTYRPITAGGKFANLIFIEDRKTVDEWIEHIKHKALVKDYIVEVGTECGRENEKFITFIRKQTYERRQAEAKL